jgi:hypothetical protein
MRHVQQSSCSISLYPHVFGFCQTSKRAQSSGSCYLRLIVLVCCQVRDATNRIALHLDVRRHHLANERCKSTEEYNGDLVFRCKQSETNRAANVKMLDLLLTARFPSAALAARCTSISGLCKRKSMGSRVSRSTSRTSMELLASSFAQPMNPSPSKLARRSLRGNISLIVPSKSDSKSCGACHIVPL